MNRKSSQKAHILIVEDVEENIEILLESLTDEFSASVATNGKMALMLVEKQSPDLILLDIQMPVMDGYETCRRLKENPDTASIPVMFITALSQYGDESKGLELGAVDYISKPFNPYLVKARVRNHVELKKYKDHLENLVQERTQSLQEMHEKLRLMDEAKSSFLGAISHELRTPANSVLGVGQLALDYIADEQMRENLKSLFEAGQQRLVETIDNALLLAQMQQNEEFYQAEVIDFGQVVENEAVSRGNDFVEKPFEINCPAMPEMPVTGNAKLLAQVVATALRIAIVMADSGSEIEVEAHPGLDQHSLIIGVKGKQFDDNLLKTVFDTFSYERASSYLSELGLAPPLAAKVAAALGGKMILENIEGSGVSIVVTIPAAH